MDAEVRARLVAAVERVLLDGNMGGAGPDREQIREDAEAVIDALRIDTWAWVALDDESWIPYRKPGDPGAYPVFRLGVLSLPPAESDT